MKDYSIRHVPGRHLTFGERQILARDWNAILDHGGRPTITGFAKAHGLSEATWHREYKRGMMSDPVPDPRDGRRMQYDEYDPFKAQDSINEGNANKGVKMKVTNHLAERFAHYVLGYSLSPYDAMCRMREEMPDRRIPCLSTWYNHIACGDIPVKYGQTPYHPDRARPKHTVAHPAKTVPGRLLLSDRPIEANGRTEPGHYEIDTILSCVGGRGGLLDAQLLQGELHIRGAGFVLLEIDHGFGLILCRYIVKKHDDNTRRGCRIWVESEEGKGTTMHVRLAEKVVSGEGSEKV